MMLALLAELALRSLVLGGAVWIGLKLLRVRNPHVHMTCVDPGAAGLLVDAAADALDHADHHPERLAAAGSGDFVDVRELAAGAAATRCCHPPRRCRRGSRHTTAPINWWAFATAVYAVVAGVLLLRLAHRRVPDLAAGPRRTADDEPWT